MTRSDLPSASRATRADTLRYGSLFSGIGGFDLGFDRAGMECAWQVEIDAAARSVLTRHWPDVPKFADVRDVGAHNLPEVDVICGGFPCQDLSVAGNRAGLDGARSGLFFELVRITHELRPSFLVWENVPGLLNSNNGRDFAAVLLALDNIGYSGAWTTLDAQHFGLAQRRRRVFGVFARNDIGAGRCAEILALQDRLYRHPTPSREAQQDVDGTLGGSSQSGGFRTTDLDNNGAFVPVARSQTTREGSRLDGERCTFVLQHAQIGRKDEAGPQGKGWQEGIAFTLDSRPTADVIAFTSKDYGGDAGELSPTLRSLNFDKSHMNGGGQVAVAGPMAVRRLTPVECSRLQGFDDGWTAGQADSSRYRQLGNAVAVPCSEWIAKRIATVLANE